MREQNEFDPGSLGAYERMLLHRLDGGGEDPRGDIPLFHVLNTSRLSPDLVEKAHAEKFLPEILRRDYIYFVAQYATPHTYPRFMPRFPKRGNSWPGFRQPRTIRNRPI